MSHARVKSAFEGALNAYAKAKGLLLALPGRNFTRPDGMYLACHTIPSQTDSQTLAGDDRIYTGIFQINVVFQGGKGTGAGDDIALELVDLFPLNATFGAVGVQVMTPVDIAAPIVSDGLISIPVLFNYRLDT